MNLDRLPLLAEWMPQDAVLLAWPHISTDWAPILPDVERTYTDVIAAITRFEPVVLLVPEDEDFQLSLPIDLSEKCIIVPCPTNDTWCRDYGPLACRWGDKRQVVDFTFNGWGQKFAACYDNQVVRTLYRRGLFAPEVSYINALDLVVEGGAVEVNSRGTMLTTHSCIAEANRNPHHSTETILSMMTERLGLQSHIMLMHGSLPNDDTDGHIDTLVRYLDDDTILYVAPTDPTGTAYEGLRLLEQELQEHSRRSGCRLIALPDVGDFRSTLVDDLLPATYANFLFVNGAIILPVYGRETDDEAIRIVREAAPHLEVVPVDCSVLVEQHGSLHCISMQIPQGFIHKDVLAHKSI